MGMGRTRYQHERFVHAEWALPVLVAKQLNTNPVVPDIINAVLVAKPGWRVMAHDSVGYSILLGNASLN
jgi:hypothetical protein